MKDIMKDWEELKAQERRDKFAAAALTGMCSNLHAKDLALVANNITNAAEMILTAWRLADLMLEDE